MCFGLLFHVIWNAVPVELEHFSNLAGTGVQLSCNKARAEKAHCKSLSGEAQNMVLGDRKGELVMVIGSGTSSLDGVQQVSNVTRIRDKLRCILGQD